MHFEFLVEGQTELTALSILMNRIIGEYQNPHSWRIHKHQGIGQLPDDFSQRPNPKDRSLLHNFPSKLRAYGKKMGSQEVVVLLLDLDERHDCHGFKKQLLSVLTACSPQPNLLVRMAIEELEAWYLGDHNAISLSYPNFNQSQFESYIQDSQCGTWEKLAEIIHPGGLGKLHGHGKRSVRILEEKVKWARKIAPNLNVEDNRSPSFCFFRDGLRRLASTI